MPKTPHDHPLAVALKLLQAFGDRGREVWQCHEATEAWVLAEEARNAELDEREVDPELPAHARVLRIKRLARSIEFMRGCVQNRRVRWRRLPVDPTTFIESEVYLQARGVFFEAVLEEVAQANAGSFTEAVLTGAIGVGKTTFAIYSQAFQQYYMSCMESAHRTLGMDLTSEIATVFQSKNLTLASDVDYLRFRAILDRSPYFRNFFPYDQSLKSQVKFPDFILVKPVAGHDTAAIGQNVIGGIIDEINFMAVIEDSKRGNAGGIHNQAIANYDAIARRRESRFARMGLVPGLLCLVSSRNYPGQFTDIKEAEARTNPQIFVYDKCLWNIDPARFSFHRGIASATLVERHGPDTPLWFPVFIGDQTRKPRILSEPEARQVSPEDEARKLVRMIPQEYRLQFENQLLSNLRDVAGVATQAMNPFLINTDAVSGAFGKTPSILSRDECDMVETKVSIYPARFVRPQMPRFVHVDLAVTKDKCGFTIGHVSHFTRIERGVGHETLPNIVIDATLAIAPPRGGEIEFESVRRLIYALRKTGLDLRWITFDDYQSRDSLQILHGQGFTVGYQSMDTNTNAYDVLKQALYDGRVQAPAHPRLQEELIRLEYDPVKAKVDHPPIGSKDIADSLAGAVYGLTMRREIWSLHNISLREIPASIHAVETKNKNSLSAKEQRNSSQSPLDVIRRGRYQDAA